MLISEIRARNRRDPLPEPKHDYCVLISEVQRPNYFVEALVDSGSKISIMKIGVLRNHFEDYEISKVPNNIAYGGVNKSPLSILGFVDICIRVHLLPQNHFLVRFAIVPDSTMVYDALLGQDFMMRPGLLVIFGLQVAMSYCDLENDMSVIEIDRSDDQRLETIECLLEKVRLQIRTRLRQSFKRFFFRQYGEMGGLRMTTKVSWNSRKKDPGILELSEEEWWQVEKSVEDLLKKKVIQSSNSSYVNHLRLKRGKMRKFIFYPDYGELEVEDNLRNPVFSDFSILILSSRSCFTCLSVKPNHSNIFLEKSSRKYTAFATRSGVFEYVKVPHGLKNGKAVFEKYLRVILKGLLRDHVFLHSNRIIIATNEDEQNAEILEQILNLLTINSLDLHLHECFFLEKEISLLNYRISKNSAMLKKFLDPIKNLRFNDEWQSVLKVFTQFKNLIPDFIPKSHLITNPLNKSMSLEEFQTLRKILTEPPILAIYSPKAKTKLWIIVEGLEFWSILLQKHLDGDFHPVCYFNRKLLPNEFKLSELKQYTIAINYAVKKFRVYLNRKPFRIVTDRKVFGLGTKINMAVSKLRNSSAKRTTP